MADITFIDTPALVVAVERHGPARGIPVVLLHGYPDDARCYDAVVADLARDGRFHLVVPYLRGYGPTRFRDPDATRSGEQAALGADLRDLLDALALGPAILAGMDWGGRAACVVAALWPERARGLVSCGGYNIQDLRAAAEPADPDAAVRHWYQWYFATGRGVRALETDPAAIARRCWTLWSPALAVSDEAWARTASSWSNPDHARVVAHSYRHRHAEADGDPALAAIDAALRPQPPIAVATVVLDGGADGVQPLGADDPWAGCFTGRYERRFLPEVGHFVPRERPDALADAVRTIAAWTEGDRSAA